jgi:hypothetical protein
LGPCWYHQDSSKESPQAFDQNYVMRYDVSLWIPQPARRASLPVAAQGRRLQYPAGSTGRSPARTVTSKETTFLGEWPTWDLPILKWGKEQGRRRFRSGWGLELPDYGPGAFASTRIRAGRRQAPRHAMPPFNGIGANEYVVVVTTSATSSLPLIRPPSGSSTLVSHAQLRLPVPVSGETDFPCIYGDQVGLGAFTSSSIPSSEAAASFDDWVLGVKDGRSYCDGLPTGGLHGQRPRRRREGKDGRVQRSASSRAALTVRSTPPPS